MTNGSDLSIHNTAETHPHVTDAALTEKIQKIMLQYSESLSKHFSAC